MTGTLTRLFTARSNRMLFFTQKVEEGMQIQWVLGAEIDLVRKSLDELEAELVPNHEELRQQRQSINTEIDAEIEAAGGHEAWAAKIDLESSDATQ
jgi:hypothetical protein